MGWPLAAGLVTSALIPYLFGGKDNDPQTISQEPLLTEDQKEAAKRMLDYAKTGNIGSYDAGERYTGDLGSYEMTGMEKTGQNQLANLMNTAIGTQQFGEGMGKEELTNLLRGDKFDPYNEKGTYTGFKKKTMRELGEAQDRLKQNMAYSGDLYSSQMGKESGLLQERGQDILSSKLADLYQDYTNKQIGAIPWALQHDQFGDEMKFREKGLNEDIAMGRIDASQKYGATQRILDDQRAKDLYSDWQRARGEDKDRINTYAAIYGGNTNWGAKDITAPGYTSQSPFANVLNNALDFGMQYWMYNSGNNKKDRYDLDRYKLDKDNSTSTYDWFDVG